jgi:hypothetical protein
MMKAKEKNKGNNKLKLVAGIALLLLGAIAFGVSLFVKDGGAVGVTGTLVFGFGGMLVASFVTASNSTE